MSAKNLDGKNRLRTKIVAFRMSPEEAIELDQRVKLLGYRTKQDYLIEAVLHGEVHAVGNAQMLFQFRIVLRDILAELKRIQHVDEMDEELMTPIRTMIEIMGAFRQRPDKAVKKEQTPEAQYGRMMHIQRLRNLMKEDVKNG